MKVLHVFNEIKFSGAEIMYAAASSIFKEEGVEMYVLSTGTSIGEYAPHFQERGVKVFHRFMPNGKNILKKIYYYFEIKKLIYELDIDLIHIHRSDAKFIFGLFSFILKLKCVYTFHNTFKSRKLTWFKHYLVRYVLKNWFNVRFHSIGQSVYENESNYYKTSTYLINNWYDSTKFFPATNLEKAKTKIKLGIQEDSFVVISTGSCTKVKNHTHIIKALANVNSKKNIVYLHLGFGQDTECEMQLTKQMDLVENVVFLGNKENVREYLICSDVYVMPSLFEGLSIASLEAMACGVPCILYDVPGLRDLVNHESSGYLIKPNVDELISQLEYCIDNSLNTKSIGICGMNEARENYSMEINVRKIVFFYQQ